MRSSYDAEPLTIDDARDAGIQARNHDEATHLRDTVS